MGTPRRGANLSSVPASNRQVDVRLPVVGPKLKPGLHAGGGALNKEARKVYFSRTAGARPLGVFVFLGTLSGRPQERRARRAQDQARTLGSRAALCAHRGAQDTA